MFINLPKPVPHYDPWVLSGESRFARLLKGAPRIAYVYERTDNSTFRYRVHNMIETIGAFWPEASATYFTLDDGALLDQVADAADIIVMCRMRYGHQVSRFIGQVRRRANVPLIFDVDDLVFDTRYVHLLMNTLNRPITEGTEWDHWFAYLGRIGETLRRCDRAITTNEYLGARITAFAGIDAAVVPNFMNEWQLDYSKRIWESKLHHRYKRDGYLHIGYFSGSPTHAKDFGLTENALVKILEKHSFVRIRMVGYLEPAGALLNYQNRIDREPFQDYVNLQGLIGSTEINIAPLQDNMFTNCKSELKYFEAAITGTPTVASPTFTFANAIRNGDNGRLAANHEWEDAILQTIEEIETYPKKYEDMAERGLLDAEEHYSWRNQIQAIRSAVTIS